MIICRGKFCETHNRECQSAHVYESLINTQANYRIHSHPESINGQIRFCVWREFPPVPDWGKIQVDRIMKAIERGERKDFRLQGEQAYWRRRR